MQRLNKSRWSNALSAEFPRFLRGLVLCNFLLSAAGSYGCCAGLTEAPCSVEAAKAAIVKADPKGIEFPGCDVQTPICQAYDHGAKRRMSASWSCGSGAFLSWYVFVEDAKGEWKLSWKPPDDLTNIMDGTLSRPQKNSDDLALDEPIFRDSDPRASPTGGNRRRLLRWNGNGFVVVRDSTEPTPAGVAGSLKNGCWRLALPPAIGYDEDGWSVGADLQAPLSKWAVIEDPCKTLQACEEEKREDASRMVHYVNDLVSSATKHNISIPAVELNGMLTLFPGARCVPVDDLGVPANRPAN